MMIKVVIVQARMTSSRLPGKVMLPLGDKTVLGQVLTRCKKIKGIDIVCCAIPIGSEHAILVAESEKYGAVVLRGSEMNVLERYYEAAKHLKADVIMRITSDCPLINPIVCEQVLNHHFLNNAQYTCNNLPPSWPHGYDCEVFNFQALEDAHQHATDSYDREHVGPWMRRHCQIQNLSNPNGNEYHVRITLDTLADYEHIKNLYMGGYF